MFNHVFILGSFHEFTSLQVQNYKSQQVIRVTKCFEMKH